MPFFFLIGGFLTNWKSSHSSFAIRKSKTLLFLFVVYSIINIFLAFGVHRFMLILKYGWGGQALWFLPILFLSLVIAKLFPDKIIVVGIFVMLLLSWLLAINHVHWRWTLASVPYATMWILIGRLSTRFINEILKRSRLERAIYSFCFLVIVSVVAYNYRLDICENRILPLIPLVISGISGSLMVIIVAAYIAKLRFFICFFNF